MYSPDRKRMSFAFRKRFDEVLLIETDLTYKYNGITNPRCIPISAYIEDEKGERTLVAIAGYGNKYKKEFERIAVKEINMHNYKCTPYTRILHYADNMFYTFSDLGWMPLDPPKMVRTKPRRRAVVSPMALINVQTPPISNSNSNSNWIQSNLQIRSNLQIQSNPQTRTRRNFKDTSEPSVTSAVATSESNRRRNQTVWALRGVY